MKKVLCVSIMFLVVPSFFIHANAWNPFKKQTYEECLLENLKGVTSDRAAFNIEMACLQTTGKDRDDERRKICDKKALTTEQRKLITSSAKIESYGYLKLEIYNGNTDISLNEMKVRLIDVDANKRFNFDISHYDVEPLSVSAEIPIKLLYIPEKWNWLLFDLYTEVCK
jgi:hypothetical protein